MNLSRKAWLIVGAVILVAALVGMYVVYFQQAREREQLSDRQDTAEALITVLTTQKNDLENRLAHAESSLNTHKARFPEVLESIEYGEYLFEIADECNVKLDPLNFPEPAGKTVGAVTYSVVSLSLPVSGTLADIFDFIDTIKTDERFASADVKSVSIDVAGAAFVNLDVYGYKG